MGKLKPHKGLTKRVKITGKGKIVRHRAGKRHLLSVKPGGKRRRMRRPVLVAESEVRKIKVLLGMR
jgi:large subunit ribosomal protein L35